MSTARRGELGPAMQAEPGFTKLWQGILLRRSQLILPDCREVFDPAIVDNRNGEKSFTAHTTVPKDGGIGRCRSRCREQYSADDGRIGRVPIVFRIRIDDKQAVRKFAGDISI